MIRDVHLQALAESALSNVETDLHNGLLASMILTRRAARRIRYIAYPFNLPAAPSATVFSYQQMLPENIARAALVVTTPFVTSYLLCDTGPTNPGATCNQVQLNNAVQVGQLPDYLLQFANVETSAITVINVSALPIAGVIFEGIYI